MSGLCRSRRAPISRREVYGKPPGLSLQFDGSSVERHVPAHFNDDIHRLPTGNRTFIPKGVYRFKSFDESDRHDLDCVVAGVARAALERP